MASVSETQAILLVHGPDRKGIVAAFSQTLFGHGCGIDLCGAFVGDAQP